MLHQAASSLWDSEFYSSVMNPGLPCYPDYVTQKPPAVKLLGQNTLGIMHGPPAIHCVLGNLCMEDN